MRKILGSRPNIVLVLIDDAGISDIGAYGGEIDTPNIDELARAGVSFRNFYSNARCSPTRASLLTGMYPARAGFAAGTLGGWQHEHPLSAYRGRLTPHLPTLAEILRDTGYHTLMAGKWHLGGSLLAENQAMVPKWKKAHPGWQLSDEELAAERNALPNQRGFDSFFGTYVGQERQFLNADSDLHFYRRNNERAELAPSGHFEPSRPGDLQSTTVSLPSSRSISKARRQLFYAPEGVTDEAISMLKAATLRDPDKPFFLYVAYQAPHKPLEAPEAIVQKYRQRYANLSEVRAARVNRWKEMGWLADDLPATSAEVQFRGREGSYAVHAALMESVDTAIGKLVRALKAEGRFDDTLLVVLSDNGAAHEVSDLFNAPFRGSKGLLWEGGIRTHAVFHWPRHVDALPMTNATGWVGDILPTILDVAGGQYPGIKDGGKPSVPDGRSLARVLAGQDVGPPEYLFFNDRGQQAVLYQGRWKLLVNPGWYLEVVRRGSTEIVLFDLLVDPTERRDLAADKPKMVKHLLSKADEWQTSQGIVDYANVLNGGGGEQETSSGRVDG